MKKLYTLISIILLSTVIIQAQTPQGFKYQAVVRDNSGLALANKLVAIRLSLLLNSTNGTSVYSEVHNIATNDFGVANLNVGSGTNTTGNFATIDWGAGTYFLKTEADITNGSNFVFLGTSQLLSVPYAMYAAKSANAANDFDKDSLNEIQNISLNGNNLQLNKNGGSIDLTKYTTDIDTDSQSLSLKGHTLAITRGNNIQLNDVDSLNEIQTITLTNNNLQLNKNGGNVDLTKYDKDSQQLVLNGNTLSITKGNTIVLSGAVDLDSDPTNEIQILTIKKDTISISKANYIILPKDNDPDSTNELQTLTYKNDTIQLSKANYIVLPKDNDRDSLNELQTLQQNGNVVTMNKGGGSIAVPNVTNAQNGSLNYATATGTNNYNLTLTPAISQYTTGMTVNFKVPNSNTGHVTINMNNLGAKPLFKNVTDTLVSNDLLQNKMLNIIYDGQKFQLISQIENNYPQFDYAHFVLDTTWSNSYFNNSALYIWNPIKFNTTKFLEGNSINKIGDTIILQKGTYRIKSDVNMSFMTLGYSRLRLHDITNNISSILGKTYTEDGYGTTNYQRNIWLEMDGYVKVVNETKFILEIFAYNQSTFRTPHMAPGNGALPPSLDNEMQNSLIIERIR
jgi:hypothetical protein